MYGISWVTVVPIFAPAPQRMRRRPSGVAYLFVFRWHWCLVTHSGDMGRHSQPQAETWESSSTASLLAVSASRLGLAV